MKKWNHDELALDLAEFIRGKTDRLTWTDMQLGPSGSPRPDVYSVPLSFARFQPLAYECKVSISDFRADITKGKWSDYLRFSCAVIFAVPEGLITKTDIPAGCGLMVRGAEGWRTIKGPTMRSLENLPRDAWVKLLIDGITREGDRNRMAGVDTWSLANKLRKTVGDNVADLLQSRIQAESAFARATEQLREAARTADTEYQNRMKDARDRAARDSAEFTGVHAELAIALGLPADAQIYSIKAAANRAITQLDANDVIADLRRQLSTIEEALSRAKRPAPVLAQVAA